MPMVISICLVVLISGCKHFQIPFSFPAKIKAAIEGDINGTKVFCEKSFSVDDHKWQVMCRIGDDMDVQYRTIPLTSNETQLEFLINKEKEGRQKIIAAPVLIVGNQEATILKTELKKGQLEIMAKQK